VINTPRKKISGSWTLDHNSSLQKEPKNEKKKIPSRTATLPHSTSSSSPFTSSLKQSGQPMASSKARRRQNSSSSEDDAYILLHPSGASAGTLGYTGDSGFEDVQPLQRLDQEVENNGRESFVPESKYVNIISSSIDYQYHGL
jgi:hypothetical protein